jgi:small subunit ribosomal protein S15
VRYSPKEAENLVIKLRKKGYSPSMIGLILRDSYGIPSVKMITGKKIKKILEENNLGMRLPEDLSNLIKNALKLEKHYKRNAHDFVAKRGFQLTMSKIKRLLKYYKRKQIIDPTWRFDLSKAALLVE